MIARGFGTAAVLMFLVLILFIIARIIGGRGPGQLSKSQLRRRAHESRKDAERLSKRSGERANAVASVSSSSSTTPWGDGT